LHAAFASQRLPGPALDLHGKVDPSLWVQCGCWAHSVCFLFNAIPDAEPPKRASLSPHLNTVPCDFTPIAMLPPSTSQDYSIMNDALYFFMVWSHSRHELNVHRLAPPLSTKSIARPYDPANWQHHDRDRDWLSSADWLHSLRLPPLACHAPQTACCAAKPVVDLSPPPAILAMRIIGGPWLLFGAV